jgi:hypothetical protein
MAKSRQQKRSQLQERRIAEDVGGRVQAGSGSSWQAKSDVRVQGAIRCEAKYTEKKTYSLKLADLLKIRDEAIRGGLETPVMQVEFVIGPGASMKYAVIGYTYFRHIFGFYNDSRTLDQKSYHVAAKQFPLDCFELRKFEAQVATRENQDWVVQLWWDGEPPNVFAVIPWHSFVTMHEAYTST